MASDGALLAVLLLLMLGMIALTDITLRRWVKYNKVGLLGWFAIVCWAAVAIGLLRLIFA